jgi:hypothetical protein
VKIFVLVTAGFPLKNYQTKLQEKRGWKPFSKHSKKYKEVYTLAVFLL